jgi:hypothetical protein
LKTRPARPSQINLMPLFPISELGVPSRERVLRGLEQVFTRPPKSSRSRPRGRSGSEPSAIPAVAGRTYSLMTNRFPTTLRSMCGWKTRRTASSIPLFVRRIISFDEPHAEVDRRNQLHVLQCSAPASGLFRDRLDGRLLKHTTYSQTRGSPHSHRATDGMVAVAGGMLDASVAPMVSGRPSPRLSGPPTDIPSED